ncbi:expressed unknown protein [Seminavis robusta]|uniref:MYND-type domain-containing protein n=1 Tax=Seminavis robusta TaxID=568900 RepID=A0A9N8EU59_9STRA|nr:expressed unknown protein [Seminavis robusta]|eukprot:Sro1695_g291760.1 n/a (607) ;mRNA; r:10038-11858
MARKRYPTRRSQRPERKAWTGRALGSPPPLTAFPALASPEKESNSHVSSSNKNSEILEGNNDNTASFVEIVKSADKEVSSIKVSEPLTPLTECSSGSDSDDSSSDEAELCLINNNDDDDGDELIGNEKTSSDDNSIIPVCLDQQFNLASNGRRKDNDLLLAIIMAHVVPGTRQKDAWTDQQRELSSDFLGALNKGMNQAADNENEQAALQTVFEATCWSFQDRFDVVYYAGETGAFLKHCRLVGLTEEEWSDIVQEAIDGYNRLVQEHKQEDDNLEEATLTVSPQEISRDLEQIRTTCWECKSCPGVELLTCVSCNIPRYCGRQCQAKAWEDGHNIKCRSLRTTHRIIRKTLGTISKAAVARSIHGVHIHPLIDLSFATMVMDPQLHAAPTQTMTTKALEGPSMTFYYQNLAAIQRGEWWIFTDACTEEHYDQVVASKAGDLTVAQEQGVLPCVQWIGWVQLLLTYNLQQVIDDSRKASDAAASIAMDALDESLDLSDVYCFPEGAPVPRLCRMNSSLTMRDMSARSSGTSVDNYEMDSAAIESLLHPDGIILRYKDFYGVSMPPEALLKQVTLDHDHHMTLEEIKARRDFAKWFVYQDLVNVHHK